VTCPLDPRFGQFSRLRLGRLRRIRDHCNGTSDAYSNKSKQCGDHCDGGAAADLRFVAPSAASVPVTQTARSPPPCRTMLRSGVTGGPLRRGCSERTCADHQQHHYDLGHHYTAPATALAPATSPTATSVTDASKAAMPPSPSQLRRVRGHQRSSNAQRLQHQSGSPNSTPYRLPNGTQQGNCIIVGLQLPMATA